MVMDLRRCGELQRAELYDVAEDARGEKNLKDCVATNDGIVREGVLACEQRGGGGGGGGGRRSPCPWFKDPYASVDPAACLFQL